MVEPGRRERKCWFCLCMCIGLTVLLLGIALIVIGNLTPLKNPIIDVQGSLEVLDHRAIEFNKNIQTCQFSGLICFCAGSIIIMLTLLVSAYERECGCHNFRNRIIQQASVDPHAWIRYANNYTVDDGARIPLSREIKAVQIEKDKHWLVSVLVTTWIVSRRILLRTLPTDYCLY